MQLLIIPSFLLSRITRKGFNIIYLNILLSNLVAVFFFIVIDKFDILFDTIPHHCFFQQVIGIPCPGCGITTGLINFFNFDVEKAYDSNPISILIGAFFFLQIILMLFTIKGKAFSKIAMSISSASNNILIVALFTRYAYRLLFITNY